MADPDWAPVWKGAWEGMARTDPKVSVQNKPEGTSHHCGLPLPQLAPAPRDASSDAAAVCALQAKWLYQGWAIRGWSDAAGASRLKALYEAVPHGQWVPLDMDVIIIMTYNIMSMSII